jgi:hypothetical protein
MEADERNAHNFPLGCNCSSYWLVNRLKKKKERNFIFFSFINTGGNEEEAS